MGAVAVVSALLTATLVIGVGRAVLPPAQAHAQTKSEVQAHAPETSPARAALR